MSGRLPSQRRFRQSVVCLDVVVNQRKPLSERFHPVFSRQYDRDRLPLHALDSQTLVGDRRMPAAMEKGLTTGEPSFGVKEHVRGVPGHEDPVRRRRAVEQVADDRRKAGALRRGPLVDGTPPQPAVHGAELLPHAAWPVHHPGSCQPREVSPRLAGSADRPHAPECNHQQADHARAFEPRTEQRSGRITAPERKPRCEHERGRSRVGQSCNRVIPDEGVRDDEAKDRR